MKRNYWPLFILFTTIGSVAIYYMLKSPELQILGFNMFFSWFLVNAFGGIYFSSLPRDENSIISYYYVTKCIYCDSVIIDSNICTGCGSEIFYEESYKC